MKLYIADAFTEKVFGGNPAGVVYIPAGADFPDEEIMRKTAAELRYSETAFLKELEEKHYHIRYFTPAAEVDLCGHATIASFWTLMESGRIRPGDICGLRTGAGDLQVQADGNRVMMDMGEAKSYGLIDTRDEMNELCRVMGADTCAVGYGKQTLKPEIISTGLADIIMPVRDLEALNGLAPDMKALSGLSAAYETVGVHAFTLSEPDGVHCRNFAPLYDIDEEAATGTANGALTYYLYKRGLLKSGEDNVFIQGEAMDRPSRIFSRLSENEDGSVLIRVGGTAAILAEGEIFIG